MNKKPQDVLAQFVDGRTPEFSVPAPEFITGPFDDTDPAAISQHALDVTGIALQNGDFDLFARFFHIPHVIETYAGRETMKSSADLEIVFKNSREQNELWGVTERVRRVLSAEFRDADTMVSAHETRLMQGNQQLRDPIPAYGVMERIDGIWMATFSAYALDDKIDPYTTLLTRSGNPLPFGKE